MTGLVGCFILDLLFHLSSSSSIDLYHLKTSRYTLLCNPHCVEFEIVKLVSYNGWHVFV
eukprot:UN03008